ncbi:cytochrome C oxidase subunit IV family protein [Candidatus Parcubacteria bacterium]|nr:cytochrome C oxidase subunit IV family protein [Candidatus Parcubacteria bacterium]
MTIKNYIIGFVSSLAITSVAFGLMFKHLASGHVWPAHDAMVPILVVLALLQLIVQLVCFLHLNKAEVRNWLTFGFALFIVVVVVGGTLWIMNNLQQSHAESDHDHVTPQTLDD